MGYVVVLYKHSMDDENKETHEIIERLARLEARIEETQKSVTQMRKIMYWRMVILLVAILVPTIAIPIFIKVFVNSYFVPEYIEYFRSFF